MSEDREYAQGGYIPGGLGCAPVHPDECLIKPSDYLDGRFVCRRPGHPTPTSDCAHAPAPAAPDTTGGELRKALAEAPEERFSYATQYATVIIDWDEEAEAIAESPALRDLLAERDTLAAQVQAVEAEIAAHPHAEFDPIASYNAFHAISRALGTPTTGGGE